MRKYVILQDRHYAAVHETSSTDRVITVVRQYKEPDIEKVWHILEVKSRKKWDMTMKSFSCVQNSKRSEDYQEFLKSQGKGGYRKNLIDFTNQVIYISHVHCNDY